MPCRVETDDEIMSSQRRSIDNANKRNERLERVKEFTLLITMIKSFPKFEFTDSNDKDYLRMETYNTMCSEYASNRHVKHFDEVFNKLEALLCYNCKKHKDVAQYLNNYECMFTEEIVQWWEHHKIEDVSDTEKLAIIIQENLDDFERSKVSSIFPHFNLKLNEDGLFEDKEVMGAFLVWHKFDIQDPTEDPDFDSLDESM